MAIAIASHQKRGEGARAADGKERGKGGAMDRLLPINVASLRRSTHLRPAAATRNDTGNMDIPVGITLHYITFNWERSCI